MSANEQTIVGWLVLAGLSLLIVWTVKARGRAKRGEVKIGRAEARFCPRCHYRGRPVWKVKGTFAVELLLYLFFILPGIAYTMWRVTNKYSVCPECGDANMVPVTSPIAKGI